MSFFVIALLILLLFFSYLCYLDLVECGTIEHMHRYKKHGELFLIVAVPFGAAIFTLWMVWRHRINTP